MLRGRLGEVRLAPLYDLASALPYCYGISEARHMKLSQKIGKDYTVRKADRLSAWNRTAGILGVDIDSVLHRGTYLASNICDAVSDAVGSLDVSMKRSPVVGGLVKLLRMRALR